MENEGLIFNRLRKYHRFIINDFDWLVNVLIDSFHENCYYEVITFYTVSQLPPASLDRILAGIALVIP